jgi:hypothetical protein
VATTETKENEMNRNLEDLILTLTAKADYITSDDQLLSVISGWLDGKAGILSASGSKNDLPDAAEALSPAAGYGG